MLYFVEMEVEMSHVPTSLKETVALAELYFIPSMEVAVNFEKENKILAGGISAGGHSMFGIFDVESNEELSRTLQGMPMWNISHVKVTALESIEHRLSRIRERVDIAKKLFE